VGSDVALALDLVAGSIVGWTVCLALGWAVGVVVSLKWEVSSMHHFVALVMKSNF
jgi:hypothetical protein